jgi:hypothetical protein
VLKTLNGRKHRGTGQGKERLNGSWQEGVG